MLAFQTRQRSRGRAKHATFTLRISSVQFLSYFQRALPGAIYLGPMNQQRCERHERRIRMIVPVANLFLIKRFVILGASMEKRVVVRVVSLNQNLSGKISAAGTTSHLRQQLKSPLS